MSVNDVWQVRALLGSEVDYSVLLFAHQALGAPGVKAERQLKKRREAVIQYVQANAPCLVKAQSAVTTLPISLHMHTHLRYKEALTDREKVIAGLAAVERADEWEEEEPGRRVAYMRFVPDPRREPQPNKVAIVCEFLKSPEATAILKIRRPFKEMRVTFDCWRFRVDKRALEKRRERRGLCYSRFLIDGSPIDTFLVNPSTIEEIVQYCFPHLIVEYLNRV